MDGCLAGVLSRRSVLRVLGMTPLALLSPLEYLGHSKASPSLGSVPLQSVPLEALRRHTERLAHFKQKRAGSEGLSEVRDFLKQRLSATGFSVQTDAFQFLAYRPKSDVLRLDGLEIPHETFAYSSGLDGRFLLTLLEGLPGNAPSNRGTLALAPITSFLEDSLAYQRASRNGAAAILFSHKGCPASPFALSIGFAFDGVQKESMPALSVPFEAISPLLDRLGEGEVFGEVRIEPDTEPTIGENLYAFSLKNPGASPIVLLAAHFDTWFEGATDDCASVALLLELASSLKRDYPLANFGFLFLDAEEVGLLGAYRSLRTLVMETGLQIKAFLNLEQAVVSPKGFTSSTFSAPGLFFDAASQALSGASGGIPVPAFLRLAWSGGASLSNLVPFYNAGVPSLTTGPVVVPAFNHTSLDTLDKVSDEALADAFRFMYQTAASVYEGGLGLGNTAPSVQETPKVVFEPKESGLEVRIVPPFLPGTIDAVVLENGFIPTLKPAMVPLENGHYRVDIPASLGSDRDAWLFVRLLGVIPAEGWLKL